MELYELLLVAVALSMDAFAAGLSDGMAEPAMSFAKHMAIAFAFGAFQFLMPVAGYYASAAFASLVQAIAPWLSFALLGFIGGKAVVADLLAQRHARPAGIRKPPRLLCSAIAAQAVATSMDALAVGVTMLAAETETGLPYPAVLCALVIGLVTFLLSAAAVYLGQKTGKKLGRRAELVGGFILILIGVKLLLEGVL